MNNKEVRLECSPKLVKGHSEVNCAHPPLVLYGVGGVVMMVFFMKAKFDYVCICT